MIRLYAEATLRATLMGENGRSSNSGRWSVAQRPMSPDEYLTRGWLLLPAAGCAECVRILVSMGWRVTRETSEEVVVEERGRRLAIPRLEPLPPSVLVAIVREVPLTPTEFIRKLDALSS